MKRALHMAGRWLRRHVRTVWASRGGGFYGFMATLTFLYLEAVDLGGDIVALTRLRSIGLQDLIRFVISNALDAVQFAISAAIWPMKWIGEFGIGLVSIALLAGVYGVFRLIQPGVLRLLEADDEELRPAQTQLDG